MLCSPLVCWLRSKALDLINSVFPLPGPPIMSSFFGPSNTASCSTVKIGAHCLLPRSGWILMSPSERLLYNSTSRFVQCSPNKNLLCCLAKRFESSFRQLIVSVLSRLRSFRVVSGTVKVVSFDASLALFM